MSSTSSCVPKKIINDASCSVSEYILGLLKQYPSKLKKLANHNVILSSDITYNKVHILSGGGSGHEPSHAGWIGKGMLTGAILGGIFASPSVASILAAIRAVTRVASSQDHHDCGGCLLIVKNYTGDRLNFGMACEIAKNEGRKVRMIIVADDTALERTKGITGARGVAGTVLVHKVAGAAAQLGMSLDQVTEMAQDMASRVCTLGIALNAVTIPGATTLNDRLNCNTIEIGMGIHGEAGMRQSPVQSADQLAETMVMHILDHGRMERKDADSGSEAVIVPTFETGDSLVVLVNNLGGKSNFEMSILANSVVSLLEGEKMKCTVSRLLVGTFMSSFDMEGASVSIASLTHAPSILVDLLDAETDAIAWPRVDCWDVTTSLGKRPSLEEIPEIPSPAPKDITTTSSRYSTIKFVQDLKYDSNSIKLKVEDVCIKLIESEPLLTNYDRIVGDGDCGMTFERGAREVLFRLETGDIVTNHPILFFESIADAISSSMGGTSGILLEMMFRKMSSHLKEISDRNLSSTKEKQQEQEQQLINASHLQDAFEEGVNAISFYGGAIVGSRTMLDALYPAVNAMKKGTNPASAAIDGAQATSSMRSASAGRSNYLNPETLMGTPDPGAIAVSIVLSCIYSD